MAFNEKLAERVRKSLSEIRGVKEKQMFGGIAFMVNDKMCVGVDKHDLMLRCPAELTDKLLAEKGVRSFDLTGKPMKGWLLIGPAATESKKDFSRWIQLALDANKNIKAKPRKKKTKK
ncbi:MAG: TfoX/Sxy family protein [Leptospirales bacterium]|nr:TfoX/Sxy family protein [Leptospirales bacterium]